jgi:HK97 family phage major capsid protein
MSDTAVEMKKKLEELDGAFEQFKKANDEALALKEDKGSVPHAKQEQVDTLSQSITDLQAELKELVKMQKQVEELENMLARADLDGSGGNATAQLEEMKAAAQLVAYKTGKPVEQVLASGEVDIEGFRNYKKSFLKLCRTTNPDTLSTEERMALSVGADPAGGYWVTPDTSGTMVKLIYQTSPMRSVASIMTIGTDALEGPRDLDEATTGWVGEQDSRPETATPETGEYRIPVNEQYALPKTTQKLLDDASFPVESWLVEKVSDKFARTENTAFVLGNGVKQPRGFLTYPAGTPSKATFEVIQVTNSGAAGAFAATDPGDPLIDMVFNIKAPLRTGAVWAMSSLTEAAVRKLKDGQGNYLWQPDFGKMTGGLLLGFPTTNFEDMPAIAANSLSLAFANWKKGYQIVDRIGIRLLKDPYTSKGYVLYYFTKRVGGDVLNFEAIKIMKFAV